MKKIEIIDVKERMKVLDTETAELKKRKKMKTPEKELSDYYGVDVQKYRTEIIMESHYCVHVNGFIAGWIIETPGFYKAKKQRDNNDGNWIRFDSSKEAIGYIVSEYIKPELRKKIK